MSDTPLTELCQKFTSGNGVPVERASVTREEFDRLDAFFSEEQRKIGRLRLRVEAVTGICRRREDILHGKLEAARSCAATSGALLRGALDFVTGDLSLMCAPGESDRECYNRCRAAWLVKTRAALEKAPK